MVLVLLLLEVFAGDVDEGDEVVATAEEHEGDGHEDGGEEADVDCEVEEGVGVLVGDRCEEVSLEIAAHHIVSDHAHQDVRACTGRQP